MKTIIICKPREGKGTFLPDQATMQIRRYYEGRRIAPNARYLVTGYSTLVEYNASTIVPLDRAVIMDLLKQWRELHGRGIWDFYLKPENHQPAFFDPRQRRIYFIEDRTSTAGSKQ